MSREPIVLRPRVTPDPAAQARLDEQMKRVVPPPDTLLHRDRVQLKLTPEEWPALLRKQAS